MISTAYRESQLCRLLLVLWCALQSSAAARLFVRAEHAIVRAVQGSALWGLCARTGVVTRSWEDSLICRLLDFLTRLISALLHRLYLLIRPVWDGSIAFRLLMGLSENIPAILSWLFLLMMVCPHEYWNNLYGLAVAVLALALIFGGAMARPSLRLKLTTFSPYLWAFFFMLCVGVVESSSRQVSLRYLLYFVTAILLSLLVLSTAERLDQLKRLAAFGAAGLPVATGYGVYQRLVLGLTNTSSTVDLSLNSDMPGRVYSFFDNANTFAQVLVMLLGVTMGLVFASRTFWGKLASLAAFGCGLAGIAMTYSRASWVGLLVAILLFVLLACPRFLPLLILGGVALLPFLPASIYNRVLTIFNTSDSSTSSRFPIYAVGLKMWAQDPVTGMGLGSELSAAAALSSGWYEGTFKFPHYHNIYLQLAVETGALGLLAYVGGFIASCKQTVRAVFAPGCPRPVRYLAAGCVSGLTGVMVCGLADYFWHYPRVMAIFWLVFGMMLACVRLSHTAQTDARATEQTP